MFEIKDLQVSFGGIHALKGISLRVEEGEIVTLIGANGAGKTTTLRTASGLERPDSGSVWLNGQDITRVSAQDRVKRGLIQVLEDAGLPYERAGEPQLGAFRGAMGQTARTWMRSSDASGARRSSSAARGPVRR